MVAVLPSNGISSANPYFIDKGGLLRPSLGGQDQRFNRRGSRWGCHFTTKPMKSDEASIWIARLVRGIREKASIKMPQPGGGLPNFQQNASVFGDGSALVDSSTIVIVHGIPDYSRSLIEGQFINGTDAIGNKYLYQVTGTGSFPGTVDLQTVPIQPPIRVHLPHLSAVNILDVVIEGYVVDQQISWSIDNAKIYGLSFTIEEAA